MSHCLVAFNHPLLRACFAAGLRLVLVGGAVRDVLCGHPLPDDLDFLVLDGDIREEADRFAQHLQAALTLDRPPRPVMLDADWGIVRMVVWWDRACYTVDLANALHNNLHTDLHRRDVTVNAIGWNGQSFDDPTGGRRDLRQGIIRQIHPDNFQDDPLRVLRVFRTASLLDGTQPAIITPDTLASCDRFAPLLPTVAKERSQVEWLKLLKCPLQQLIPLIGSMPTAVLSQFSALPATDVLPRLNQWQQVLDTHPAWVDLINQAHPAVQGLPGMAWLTWLVLDEPMTVIRHFPLSREARGMLTLWQKKWPVGALDTPHPDVAHGSLWRERGPALPGALALQLLGKPKTPVAHYLDAWQHYMTNAANTPPLVTGHVITAQWGEAAGPRIQQALNIIRDAQLAGVITTVEEAKAFWDNNKPVN